MKKKIKVLVITHTFPTKQNPIAAIFLLNQLKALKKYCDVKIIFPYAYIPRFRLLSLTIATPLCLKKRVLRGLKFITRNIS